MPPKFGTSGLRGLVTELTPECVTGYVHAFVAACPVGACVYVGHDLRASSPDLAQRVSDAVQSAGLDVAVCGPVPTPALAMAAMDAKASAIMVTGSHIPADRNGLKFYTPAGEITKTQEQAILAQVGRTEASKTQGQRRACDDVMAGYHDRYASTFSKALAGQRIGLFMHSAVGRDSLAALLTALGAIVVPLGRTDAFVPVDTEAVSDAFRAQFREWAHRHQCDAIVSTDADGDRPLLTDETGKVVPGDLLGQITARQLGAQTVVTPVSSNSGVAISGEFPTVLRTKIGSPYVLEAMEKADDRVIGYEANGGFILGSAVNGPTGLIAPLMTRDAVLPLLSVLSAAQGGKISDLVAAEPACVTAADRLQDVDVVRATDLIASLTGDQAARQDFLMGMAATEVSLDLTDGLRIHLHGDQIVHLRLSGNAPELRVYVEASTKELADALLRRSLNGVAALLKG